jgi:hypothetical protein
MKKQLLIALSICLLVQIPARPYTFNFTGGNHDHWPSAPQYLINTNLSGSHVTVAGGRSVTQVVNAAFATWAAAPNSAANATFAGTTSAGFNNSDHQNTICFNCSGDFSQDASTLAFTATSTDASGNILDADILFNPAKEFTTDLTVGGQTAQDLETVAAHEIGHFFGISHSGVVRAMMFPFAPDLQRTLGYDDVMIVAQLYPVGGTVSAHTISGTVRLAGAAVFGAQVVADSATNFESPGMLAANIRKTPISALTDTTGTYSILVPDDTYEVYAEPLDEPMSNSDISDFASHFGRSAVQTNFTTRWH